MRVCMMAPWPSVHTEHWLKALSQRDHEVHLLLPDDPKDGVATLPNRIISHSFSKRTQLSKIGPIIKALELRYRLGRIAPDVFHIHSVFAVAKWQQFPWALAMATFHPLVLTAWGSDLLRTENVSKAAKMLTRFVLRSADLVTADAQSLLDAAHGMGVSRERLYEIQFGVDTDLFNPEVETAIARKKLDLNAGPVIYSPRAFMPIYNQLSIVEAIPKILRIYPECKFMFKIRSDYHSPDYEKQIRQRIQELGVTGAVRIIPPLPYHQLPALYAVSDMVISIPISDGTPRSVLEAMACGTFPVVSDVPALHNWIKDGDNGIIIKSTEASQIAEAILRVLSSPATVHRARLKNRRTIESKGSTNFWVIQLEALYNQVIR